MGRIVICQFCGETVPFSERETLAKEVKVSESTGKAKNLYYHHECYPEHLEKQEFLLKEKTEKDALYDTMKSIYGVQYQLPDQWWEFVNDLRNGTNRFKKFWKKQYKKGIPYPVIREAYLMSKSDIEWARLNKKFQTTDKELRYGLAIIQGKLNDADKRLKANAQQQKMASAIEKTQLDMMSDNREVTYRKQAKEDDLSFLLGND